MVIKVKFFLTILAGCMRLSKIFFTFTQGILTVTNYVINA